MDHPRTILRPYNAPGLFITATGTDIGKTTVTAALAACFRQLHVRTGIIKPFASGCPPLKTLTRPPQSDDDYTCPDAEIVATAAGLDPADKSLLRYMAPVRYGAPVSPALASHLESRPPDWHRVAAALDYWQEEAELLLVEGAGGWYVPLDQSPRDFMIADFAAALRLPVLVVTTAQLGAINQTLLTVHAIQQRNLAVVGLVINRVPSTTNRDSAVASNLTEIPRLAGVPCRAILPDLNPAHPATLTHFRDLLLPFATDWWLMSRVAE